MQKEDNLDLIHRYVAEVWDSAHPADPEVIRRFLSPSFRRHLLALGSPLDLEATIDRLQGLTTAFPDLKMTLEDLIVDDDKVAMRATLRATHMGEFLGIPPTGKQITVTIVDIFRVEQGQLVEGWGGFDVFDMLSQMGASVTIPS